MAVLPKAIYMFHGIPIKIPMTFMIDIENKPCSSFGSTKANTTLSKKCSAVAITIPDFKLYS
jgi:hypothetical protein